MAGKTKPAGRQRRAAFILTQVTAFTLPRRLHTSHDVNEFFDSREFVTRLRPSCLDVILFILTNLAHCILPIHSTIEVE